MPARIKAHSTFPAVAIASRVTTVSSVMLALTVAALSGSCADSPKSDPKTLVRRDAGKASSDAGAAEAAAPPIQFNPDASPGFEVSVSASASRICAGECVALNASATGGVAPYRYAWSPNLGEGAGPHEVCPTRTSQYQVVATDAMAGATEFASDPVIASVEVSVDGVCLDSGPKADANAIEDSGTDGETDADVSTQESDSGAPVPKEMTELCRATIALTPLESTSTNQAPFVGYQYLSMLAVDKQDNFIVTTGFSGRLDLGGEVLDSKAAQYALLVAKYDADCNLVWGRSYGSLFAFLAGASVATSGTEIVIAGEFKLAADFGRGVMLSYSSLSSAMLVKLDALGNTIWSKSFSGTTDVSFRDVAVDNAGNIVVSGFSFEPVSLGGETLSSLSDDTYVAFIAKFSPNGEHLWSKVVPESLFDIAIGTTEDNLIVMARWANEDAIMTVMDEDGNEVWSVRQSESESAYIIEPFGFDVNPSGVVSWGSFIDSQDANVRLHHTDIRQRSDSSVSLARVFQQVFGCELLAIDREGYVLEAGTFDQIMAGIPVTLLGGSDVFLFRYDDRGTEVGFANYGSADSDTPFAFASDSQNHPLLGVVTQKADMSAELILIRYQR